MNYKKIVSFFLLLSITTTFLLSCNKDDKNSIVKENENIATETTEWTFNKLVQESDCCLIVFVNQDEKENWNSKVIDGEYYSTFKLSKPQYIPQFFSFPDEITVIQKESAFLEETNELKKTRFYILFLNKTENEHTYYITNNKNGVIETDLNYLYPFDEALKNELDENFEAKSPHQFKKFLSWLTNEYKFSETTYETSEPTRTKTITKNTTTNPNVTPDIP